MSKKKRLCGSLRPGDSRTSCQRDPGHRGHCRATVRTNRGRKTFAWMPKIMKKVVTLVPMSVGD